MVLNGEYFRSQKSNDLDAAYKLLHSTTLSRDEFREFKDLMEENGNMDIDYNTYLVNIYVKENSMVSKRKHRGKDEKRSFSHEEENDCEYELFLKKLKKHENSYMVEYEENGESVVIKYEEESSSDEGESSSDEECDLEPRKKLKSAMKQEDGPSTKMPRVENRGMLDSQSSPKMESKKKLTWRETSSMSKSEKEENSKLSSGKIVRRTTYPHSDSTRTPKGHSSLDNHCSLPKRKLRSANKQKPEHFNQMPDVSSDDSQSTSMEEMKNLTGKGYEGESSSDSECDLEPRKKLKNANGPSTEMPRVENRGMRDLQSTPRKEIKKTWTCRPTSSKSKSEKEENSKLSTRKSVQRTTYPHSDSTRTLKGFSSSDIDGSLPKRKLRSATKQKPEHFNQMPDVSSDDSQSTSMEEIKNLTGKSLGYKFKREKEEDIMQLDPDYYAMLENSKIVNGHFAFTVGGHEVVYEVRNGESIRENKEHDKESYSDVEILDSPFYNAGESNISNHMDSTRQSEFRHKVITALRKPFDEVEYKKLWQDIEQRKPSERHLDLRGGREISYGEQKIGKSYLDYHPDLNSELLSAHGDKPRCLNLLRGFFLWLKLPEPPFSPWLDKECLAIYPESD